MSLTVTRSFLSWVVFSITKDTKRQLVLFSSEEKKKKNIDFSSNNPVYLSGFQSFEYFNSHRGFLPFKTSVLTNCLSPVMVSCYCNFH